MHSYIGNFSTSEGGGCSTPLVNAGISRVAPSIATESATKLRSASTTSPGRSLSRYLSAQLHVCTCLKLCLPNHAMDKRHTCTYVYVCIHAHIPSHSHAHARHRMLIVATMAIGNVLLPECCFTSPMQRRQLAWLEPYQVCRRYG